LRVSYIGTVSSYLFNLCFSLFSLIFSLTLILFFQIPYSFIFSDKTPNFLRDQIAPPTSFSPISRKLNDADKIVIRTNSLGCLEGDEYIEEDPDNSIANKCPNNALYLTLSYSGHSDDMDFLLKPVHFHLIVEGHIARFVPVTYGVSRILTFIGIVLFIFFKFISPKVKSFLKDELKKHG
jgi:hypothetical protein